jgi:photosystem II stability/assembly factor-like uncharacterized protein
MKMFRKGRIVLLFLPFFLFLVDKLYAQPYPKNYPCIHRLDAYTVYAHSLAIHPINPDILFLGTDSDLYKSTDGGLTWYESNTYGSNGMPRFSKIWAVAIDPVNPDVVYAGTAFKGLYKSMDGGLTWSKVFPGEESKSRITSIAINPLNPQIVYIAVTNGSQYQGVYKSTDGGATWQAKNNGLYELSVGPIVMDPNNPDVLYLGGTVSYPLYKSTDGGETWVLLNPVDGYAIESIAVNPSNSSIVYAASVHDVYKSTDGGASWFPLNITSSDYAFWGCKAYPLYITIDENNPDVLYVGTDWCWIIKSTDGGNTWEKLPPAISNYERVEFVDVDNSGNIYAFSWGHLYKSTDGGNTWRIIDKGIRVMGVSGTNSLKVAPSNQDIIYAAGDEDDGGMWKSIDGGRTWEVVKTLNFAPNIMSIAISPLDPEVVFAGINVVPPRTLYKSTDGGNTWVYKERLGGSDGFMPWAIKFAPSNPSIMFSGADATLYKSVDYGESWTMVFNADAPDLMDIEINPSNPDIVYITFAHNGTPSTDPDIGTWKSVDGGNTFFKIINGLPLAPDGLPCTVEDLLIDPSNPDVIYAAISQLGYHARGPNCWGVFKSTNGGASWSRLPGLNYQRYHEISSLAIDPDNTNIIYAASRNDDIVFVSYDGGSTWDIIPLGSEYIYSHIGAIQLTNTSPRNLFMTTPEGIFKVTIPPAIGARPITYCECPGQARVWVTYPEHLNDSPTWYLSGNRFTVFADYLCGSPDEFEKVLFQYRPYENTYAPPDGGVWDIPWQDIPSASPSHPNPDYTYPYFVHIDLTQLTDWTTYEVRAIAYHKSGRVDEWVLRGDFFVDQVGPQDELQYLNAEGEQEVRKVFWKDEENRLLVGHPEKDLYDELFLSGSGLPANDTIIYTIENPSEHEAKVDKTRYRSIGEFRSVSFSSGLTTFINGQLATLRIGYPDSNQDGKVDGTSISETSLKVYRYISGTNWEEIPSTVLTDTNQVEVKVGRLSLFSILAPIPPSQGQAFTCKRNQSTSSCNRRSNCSMLKDGTYFDPSFIIMFLSVTIFIIYHRVRVRSR